MTWSTLDPYTCHWHRIPTFAFRSVYLRPIYISSLRLSSMSQFFFLFLVPLFRLFFLCLFSMLYTSFTFISCISAPYTLISLSRLAYATTRHINRLSYECISPVTHWTEIPNLKFFDSYSFRQHSRRSSSRFELGSGTLDDIKCRAKYHNSLYIQRSFLKRLCTIRHWLEIQKAFVREHLGA